MRSTTSLKGNRASARRSTGRRTPTKAAKAIHNPPKVYGVGMPLGRNPSLENTLGALILGNGGHFCLPRFERRRVRLPEVRETIDMIKELAGKFANAIG